MNNTHQTQNSNPLYGEISTVDALRALYSGVPEGIARKITVSKDLPADAEYLAWTGGIAGQNNEPGPVGTYIIANPYRISDLHTRADGRDDKGRVRGLDRVLTYRSGVRADDVGLYCVAQAEIDDIPIDEQFARLHWLETETGIEWNVLALSGDTRPASTDAAPGVFPRDVQAGKSVHAFKALTPTDLATFTEIQLHLVVLLRSDPSIINPDRLMRKPGAIGRRLGEMAGPARIQTCLRAQAGGVDAHDYLNALKALAAREGIADVHAAFAAIQFAEICRKKAKDSSAGTVADELRQIAGAVKLARTVTDDQRNRYSAITGALVVVGNKGRKGKVSTTTRQEIPAGTKVIIANGNVISMDDTTIPANGYRCWDPILETPGKSKSPSARIFPGGRIFSEAGGGRVVYTPSVILPMDEEEIDLDTIEGCHSTSATIIENESVVTPPLGRTFKTVTRYTTENLVGGKYLPKEPFAARVLYLKAPKGAGKTELASYLAESCGSRKIASCHRRSLCDSVGTRLGLPDYRKQKGGISGDAVVCLDSLYRVQNHVIVPVDGTPFGLVEEHGIGLLFIDEIKQYRHSLFTGKMDGFESQRAMTALARVLQASAQIVVGDADLDAEDVDFIRELLGWTDESKYNEEIRIIEGQKDPVEYHVTTDRNLMDATVIRLSKDDGFIFVPMMAEKDAERVHAMLSKENPGKKYLLLTAETVADLRDALKDPNQLLQGYDGCVASPVIGTGVSIDFPVQNVCGYLYTGVGTALDGDQALRRPRKITSGKVHVWISPGGTEKELDPDLIRAEVLAVARKTQKQAHEANLTDRVVIDPVSGEVVYDRHFKWFCRTLAERRATGADGCRILKPFVTYLRGRGAHVVELDAGSVTDAEREDVRQKAKEGRQQATEARAERQLAAPNLTIDAARAIREPSSSSEINGIQKAELADFHGLQAEAVTKEMILQDQDGDYRDKLRTYADTKAAAEGHGVALLRKDAADIERGSIGHMRNRYARAKARIKVLSWFGVGCDNTFANYIQKESVVTLDRGLWSSAAKKAIAARRALAELGITVRSDVSDKPLLLLSAVLGSMGLSLQSSRRRVDGEIVREYWIDAESVATVEADSAHYYTRLITPPPKTEEERQTEAAAEIEKIIESWDQAA